MSTLVSVLLLAGGLVLVVAGAEALFDGLLGTAARFGVAPFAFTLVVSGFEPENLAAGIAANLKGLGNAAAGTFLGGTTFLALAVAGLAAAVAPVRAELPRAVLVWTALSPLPLLGLGLDGHLSRLDGALLVGWFVVATAGTVRAGRALPRGEPPRRDRFAAARLLVGLGVLVGGGVLLGQGLSRVVRSLGVPASLLGNTAIAAAVEAEEVTRVAVPARRGRGDIAMANVFGTVLHFAALNAGVIALVRPITLDSPTRHVHLPVAAASVVLLVAAVATRRGLSRRDGILLLGLYATYVAVAVSVSL
jgi:cation:H+ antiporter